MGVEGPNRGERGKGRAGEDGGMRKIMHICMSAPALPSSPSSCQGRSGEGGEDSGRMRREGAAWESSI